MLKRLRLKFIISNTTHVGIVLLIVFVSICIISYTQSYSSLNDRLFSALDRSTQSLQAQTPLRIDGTENMPDTEFIPYIICVLPNGETDNMYTIEYGATVSDSALAGAVTLALESEDEAGSAQDNLYFAKKRYDSEIRIALTNDSHVMDSSKSMAKMLLLISGCAVGLVAAVSFPVAKGALHSTENAWMQQKRFIADASHALKTPLTVILANNEILKNSTFGANEENRHWLKSTEDEAHEMSELVQEMLILAQSDLNVHREEFEQINLSQLVIGVCLQFDALAFDKDIRMETIIQDNVEMRGNKKGLSQMISALVDNALKYEKEHGYVCIRLEKQVRKTVLSVFNASTWIRPEEQERVFDRFCRLKNPQNSAVEGHGLGLSIARSVADAHSAAISIESAENKGTMFKVIL